VDRSPVKRALILLAIASVIGLIIAYRVPVCPTATFLGIPCPGCGLTRATLALFRGDFSTALRFHPLVFLLSPLFAYLALNAAWGYVRGPVAIQTPRERTFWTSRFTTIAASAVIALMLVVWIARFFGAFGGPVPVQHLHL
jgi:hypothetical protein